MIGPDEIAARLHSQGLSICPDFLDGVALDEIRGDLDTLFASGQFYRAGTGRGEHRQIQDGVRRDEIHWLERDGVSPVQGRLWARLDALKLAFNQRLFLGINDFEGHYAVYPEGGFYRRHRDAFRGQAAAGSARLVSFVLYLNRDWQPGDGGELRIYSEDAAYFDIAPVGGTLVCFLSDEIDHEVLPSLRPRASFVGWFKRSLRPAPDHAR